MLGVAVFAAGLLILFPARVAYTLFAPDGLRLSGLGGSLWHGTAREGEVGGLYLRDLEWRLRPVALLTGRLALSISVSPAGGFLESEVALSPGGRIGFEQLRGGASLGALQSLTPMPGIEGSVRLDLEQLVLSQGVPTRADGTIEVMSLVARGLSAAPIGDFRADLVSTDGAITGSVEDLGGILDIAGSLRVGADRSYLFEGLVAPTDEAPPGVVDQLRFLGSANERGQRRFRFEGRL